MMRSKTDTINRCDIDSVVIALSIDQVDLDRESTTDTYRCAFARIQLQAM
jgi:hypothetical protein